MWEGENEGPERRHDWVGVLEQVSGWDSSCTHQYALHEPMMSIHAWGAQEWVRNVLFKGGGHISKVSLNQ